MTSPDREPFRAGTRQVRVTIVEGNRMAVSAGTDFAALYREQYAPMLRLAQVTIGGQAHAEDLVQEAFVDVYRAFSEIENPIGYLRRAVLSRAVSWLRRRQVELRYSRRQRPPEATAALSPDGMAVRAALSQLRPRARAAVYLRYYLDLPEAQIAEALDCRLGTVKSILHRAQRTLRRYLDDPD